MEPSGVVAWFTIPHGTDYRDHLPAMGLSPELEGVSSVYVVVYSGPMTMRYLTGQAGVERDPRVTDVVCVVTADGFPNIYTDVSREGLSVPNGAAPSG